VNPMDDAGATDPQEEAAMTTLSELLRRYQEQQRQTAPGGPWQPEK
jgi:hypothetical protein